MNVRGLRKLNPIMCDTQMCLWSKRYLCETTRRPPHCWDRQTALRLTVGDRLVATSMSPQKETRPDRKRPGKCGATRPTLAVAKPQPCQPRCQPIASGHTPTGCSTRTAHAKPPPKGGLSFLSRSSNNR